MRLLRANEFAMQDATPLEDLQKVVPKTLYLKNLRKVKLAIPENMQRIHDCTSKKVFSWKYGPGNQLQKHREKDSQKNKNSSMNRKNTNFSIYFGSCFGPFYGGFHVAFASFLWRLSRSFCSPGANLIEKKFQAKIVPEQACGVFRYTLTDTLEIKTRILLPRVCFNFLFSFSKFLDLKNGQHLMVSPKN